MVVALSKTYKSPIVDTIQSLPQHQQVTLCQEHDVNMVYDILQINVCFIYTMMLSIEYSLHIHPFTSRIR